MNILRLILHLATAFGSLWFLTSCSDVIDNTRLDLSIKAESLSYSQKASFKLIGSSLERVSRVTVSNCSGLAEETVQDVSYRLLTCRVNNTGELHVDLRDAEGEILFSTSFQIQNPQVIFITNFGRIKVELFPESVPYTVHNFLSYVHSGFYSNTIFHRVIDGYIVQGGWLNSIPAVQTGVLSPIILESTSGLSNKRGTIGMARGEEFDSATSQFYFNLSDNLGFDYRDDFNRGYAVFGRVVEGLEVLDAIGKVSSGDKYGLRNFPSVNVVVESVTQSQ